MSEMQLLKSTTLRYGQGCFETIKVLADGPVLFLSEHLKRLFEGAKVCGFEIELNLDSALEEVQKFCQKKSSTSTQVLRILAFEGSFEYYLEDFKESTSALNLAVSSKWRIDSSSPLNAFKTFNYLKNHLAFKEAADNGFDDVILLNESGEIAETSKANIFFCDEQNNWLTPPVASGCLPGIIRAKLVPLLNASEKALKPEDLPRFKHCFVCNSLNEARSVRQILNQTFELFDCKQIKDKIYVLSH